MLLNKKYNLKEGLEARNEWRANNSDLWNQEMRVLWKEAVEEAKATNKILVVSDMLMLREFEKDFDKVITISKDLFIKRSKLRNDYNDNTESWKNNIDKTLSLVPKEKLFYTSKYFSDLFLNTESFSNRGYINNLLLQANQQGLGNNQTLDGKISDTPASMTYMAKGVLKEFDVILTPEFIFQETKESLRDDLIIKSSWDDDIISTWYNDIVLEAKSEKELSDKINEYINTLNLPSLEDVKSERKQKERKLRIFFRKHRELV